MGQVDHVLESFSGVLHRLYAAAQEQSAGEFQDTVLRLLTPHLSFDSSMWGAGALDGGAVVVHSMHLHEQPQEMIDNWQHVNHEDTIAREVTSRLGTPYNGHMPSLFPANSAMRDHTLRFDIGNCLVVCSQKRGLFHWITLIRSDADRQYSDRDSTLLKALWPHITQALTINRLLQLDRLYLDAGRARAQSALAVVDRKGAIYHAEPSFEAMLRKEWPHWSGGTLDAHLVASVERAAEWRYRGEAITLEFRRASDLFFVKARELNAFDRLSPREGEVARSFSRGESHKEIARRLGLSPATVRNHLQVVYRKLGVDDKGALATLLAGG